MLPPTSQLPSIKSISKYSLESLENAVEYLRSIYNPQVRGSRRRKPLSGPSKERGQGHQENSRQELDALRVDPFERGYSIKWLTALIAQFGLDAEDEGSEAFKMDALIENAASLLATCAGTASAGLITRCFTFDLVDSPTPIMVELTDVPLDNQDYGSVGAQTWGGACIMAEMIAESPDTFGLPTSGPSKSTLRCLELGAGTGLVGLTVAKAMEQLIAKHKLDLDIDIVATDYYPSVLANLERNVQSNFRTADAPRIANHVHFLTSHLDWSTFYTSENIPLVFKDGKDGFDVVYGADIIYEAQHATWIKQCLVKLLRKPLHSFDKQPVFHLIIPLRATHVVESRTIEQIFQNSNIHTNDNTQTQETMDKDLELVIKHKEVIICDAESGKDGEEIEYAYYRIGWGWS